MKKTEFYEAQAEACRELLRKHYYRAQHEQAIKDMIAAWETLARTRDENVARKKRIKKLLDGT